MFFFLIFHLFWIQYNTMQSFKKHIIFLNTMQQHNTISFNSISRKPRNLIFFNTIQYNAIFLKTHVIFLIFNLFWIQYNTMQSFNKHIIFLNTMQQHNTISFNSISRKPRNLIFFNTIQYNAIFLKTHVIFLIFNLFWIQYNTMQSL